MSKARQTRLGKAPMPLRLFFARPRPFISIVVGIAVGALLPFFFSELRGVTRLLVGWDIGVALYLVLAFWMIAHSSASQIKRQSLHQDEGGVAILIGTIVAAMASVAAVITWLEAATRAQTFAPQNLAFLFVTVLLSWAFIHIMFALHYAHEFYSLHGKQGKGGSSSRMIRNRLTGTSSILPLPSAPLLRCPTCRSHRRESARQFGDTASSLSFSMSR